MLQDTQPRVCVTHWRWNAPVCAAIDVAPALDNVAMEISKAHRSECLVVVRIILAARCNDCICEMLLQKNLAQHISVNDATLSVWTHGRKYARGDQRGWRRTPEAFPGTQILRAACRG